MHPYLERKRAHEMLGVFNFLDTVRAKARWLNLCEVKAHFA